MAKPKPLLPSLREKKRYLAFEVISDVPISDKRLVQKAITGAVHDFFGTLEESKAGVMFLPELYDAQSQKGVLKVNHNYLDKLRASLALARIAEHGAIIRSVVASGMIKKASKGGIKCNR